MSVSNLLELLCGLLGASTHLSNESQPFSQPVSPHDNRIQILLAKIDSDHFVDFFYGFLHVKS
jgi:hypothetical protein